MLTGAGLGDDLLAHVLGQQCLAHAVVELMGTGVVQILPLDVELDIAQGIGQPLQVGHRGGTALELSADAAQFMDELAGLADGEIGVGDLVHGHLELRGGVGTAIFAEIALFIRVVLEIGVKFHAVILHIGIPPIKSSGQPYCFALRAEKSSGTDISSGNEKTSPTEIDSVKDEYIRSAVPPCFTAYAVPSAGYQHAPAADACLTSQYTRSRPFPAPSAVHLTVCFPPGSQHRRLSVGA